MFCRIMILMSSVWAVHGIGVGNVEGDAIAVGYEVCMRLPRGFEAWFEYSSG